MDAKINKLMNNIEFKSQLDKLQTEDEIIALFEGNGVKVVFDYEFLEEEISEQSLENITGGRIVFAPWIWKQIGGKFVKCILMA